MPTGWRSASLDRQARMATEVTTGADELARLAKTALNSAQSTEPELWTPTLQSAHDLMRKELPPVRWAVEDAIPEGLTLLAAKAKKGKSTLMLQIAVSIAQGARALDHFETTAGEVLYLALEDNERRMQKRLRQMLQGEEAPAGLQFAYQWPPLDHGGLEALEKYLDEHPATFCVIADTLEHIRPARRANGGYGDDYASVRGLQQLTGRRPLAVVAITHLRKAPATDPFDEINATMGLLASIDNALVMRSANGMMELHRRGRDFEDDSTLALRGDRNTLLWRVEGVAQEVMRSAERKAIIECLPDEAASAGLKPAEIADALDKPSGTIRKLLSSMLSEGSPAIKVDDKGCYRKCGNGGNGGNAGNAKVNCPPESPPNDGSRPTTIVTEGGNAVTRSVAIGNAPDPLAHTSHVDVLAASPPLLGSQGIINRVPPQRDAFTHFKQSAAPMPTEHCDHPQRARFHLKSGVIVCGLCCVHLPETSQAVGLLAAERPALIVAPTMLRTAGATDEAPR